MMANIQHTSGKTITGGPADPKFILNNDKLYQSFLTSPFLHPEANFFPSGDQAICNIQCVWP